MSFIIAFLVVVNVLVIYGCVVEGKKRKLNLFIFLLIYIFGAIISTFGFIAFADQCEDTLSTIAIFILGIVFAFNGIPAILLFAIYMFPIKGKYLCKKCGNNRSEVPICGVCGSELIEEKSLNVKY